MLQVESHGEAWYVSPDNLLRYYLGRPYDAWSLMRSKGIGITNNDLKKIAVGTDFLSGTDIDKDGLPDKFEQAIGSDPQKADTDKDGFNDKDELERNYDPNGTDKLTISNSLATKLKGKILLEVQEKGEAWYINPVDLKRYFLGSPADAFILMRNLGTGISNSDLELIKTLVPNYNISSIENKIFELVNAERKAKGLSPVKLNSDLSAVAREHSQNLARENLSFTGLAVTCSFPIIHHEGFDFGTYHNDRLNSRNIYYFSRSAENIALMSTPIFRYSYQPGDGTLEQVESCRADYNKWEADLKTRLENEKNEADKLNLIKDDIARRTEAFKSAKDLKLVEINWKTIDKLSQDTVTGWMNSTGHRENILNSEYDESGIGTAYVNGSVITTQIFIKKAGCGFKGGACCQKTGYYPYCFEPYDCNKNKCE